jgi:hypothetical protein
VSWWKGLKAFSAKMKLGYCLTEKNDINQKVRKGGGFGGMVRTEGLNRGANGGDLIERFDDYQDFFGKKILANRWKSAEVDVISLITKTLFSWKKSLRSFPAFFPFRPSALNI